MEIKLILLRNGTYLISQISEMEMEPSCFLADPMEIVEGELKTFPRYTNQRNVLLYSDIVFCSLFVSTFVLLLIVLILGMQI